jgi:hypothetical protein
MNQQIETLEEIRDTLVHLRANPKSRRKFPVEIWKSIIQLTHTYSLEQVCQQLDIQPAYLKQKIKQLEQFQKNRVDFIEVSPLFPITQADSVTIELTSSSGIKALIRGSTSCLNILSSLFKE